MSPRHPTKIVATSTWLLPPVQIPLAMASGLAAGALWPSFGRFIEPLGIVFVQAIKMIVIPLVFSTVTLGACAMARGAGRLGRIACVTFGFFILATLIAALTGLALDRWLAPGLGSSLLANGKTPQPVTVSIHWREYLLELIPANVIAAMAAQKVLPTVIFALLFGFALGRLGEQAAPVTRLLETLAQAVALMTKWIVAIAPVAVFAVLAWLAATQGVATLSALAKLIGVMYLGFAVIAVFLMAVLRACGEKPLGVIRQVGEPLALAFTMRSMEIALPLQLQKLANLGVPDRIASVVLPLSYSFNLTGSAMYLALASTFLAEAYGVHLDRQSLGAMLLAALIASKGVANVPAGSLVALATVLTTIGLPPEAIALITGVDIFLDMGRTAINFLSSTVAVLLVRRFGGQPGDRIDEDAATPPSLGPPS